VAIILLTRAGVAVSIVLPEGNMGRAVFTIVLYLATAPNALAYAAIPVGYSGDALQIAASVAHRVALHQVAQNSEETPPTPEAQPDTPQDFSWLGPLFEYLGRYWSTVYVLATFAGGVASFLLVRLAIAIFSTASTVVLKERSLICAWLGIPVALSLSDIWKLWYHGPFADLAPFILLMWSAVFGALMLGGRIRNRISVKWKAPPPLSLPLASLAFTAVATVPALLYLVYGGLPRSSCGSPPYPYLSLCEFLMWQGGYLVAATLLLIIVCGAVLRPDSNLILPYHALGAFIRMSLAARRAKRQKWREEAKRVVAEAMSAEPGSYPVPALYSAPMLEAMRLLLKRSQRTSVFGKVIFVLDARMELTRDEYDLLRKYRLGDDVIYESSSRQRRKEAVQAHLEMTKGGPALSDSAGAQLMGVAKSLFWFGRASISATAASLSLRITIHGLLSGVHVECKSMNELLEAERAIREAAEGLRAYLDIAATFDGREEIVELR
jgi:hypothetical protein